MKSIFSISAVVLTALSLSFTACKKDEASTPDPVTPTTGTMRVQMMPLFGDSLLDLNTETYITANGDTLVISAFKFYMSNIVLTKDNGDTYTVPESYYLVNTADAASQSFTLSNVPTGNYTTISFLIGIDSTRNVSGTQTGALDPAHGMFWTWSSGYIMAKLEGTSPQSTANMNMVMLHIGGFTGANSGLRNVTLPMPVNAVVTTGGSPVITVSADAAEWFAAPNVIDLSTTSTIMMPSTVSASIADNYSDMFTVELVEN